MESKKETSYTYKVEDSAKRMDDILDTDDNDYKDKSHNRHSTLLLFWQSTDCTVRQSPVQ